MSTMRKSMRNSQKNMVSKNSQSLKWVVWSVESVTTNLKQRWQTKRTIGKAQRS